MDKSGSVAKNIVAAPTFDPVRDVEYGCQHLEEFMSGNPTASEKLANAFITHQSQLGKPHDTQTTRDPRDPSHTAQTTLRSTYLCLQCATVSTAEDRAAHCQTRLHNWCIESRSGCLWCSACDDFIYDPMFEKIRIEQSLPRTVSAEKYRAEYVAQLMTTLDSRKRKLHAIYPSGEEDKFVLPNSNSLSCQAGAPRGMWNLGLTCYLSVILQAMIHNPLMRNYFLSSRHDTAECLHDNCIICAMTASFIDVLATEKVDGHGPVEMLSKSWKNHPGLAGYHQQDAHEYFQSLIDHLHSSSGEAQSRDCTCVFHQIFYGKLRSTVTCMSCRNQTAAEDPIVDLSLDLRQQAKRRKLDARPGQPKGSTAEDTPLDLVQCLRNFTSPEKLAADSYTCRSKECKDTPQRARKHLTIKKLPPTLCIQLKRYEHNKVNPQKIDTKMVFPLQLDMTPFTSRALRRATTSGKGGGGTPGNTPRKGSQAAGAADDPALQALGPRSPGWYDLAAVVVHVGKMDAGHYLCYCRRGDTWFKYDDSKVTLASEAQVLAVDAYLLFYIVRSLGAPPPPPPLTTTAAVSSGRRTSELDAATVTKTED